MRYFLELSYNGGAYHGWQVQTNAMTVQEKINHGLSTKLGEPIECVGSGRTDAGVHAKMQICHFDCKVVIEDTLDFIRQMNSLLPKDISACRVYEVRHDASARFDATSRSYCYKINRRKNPFLTDLSYTFGRSVSVEKMNEVCELLKTWKDFEAFSKVHTDVHTFDCKIIDACWKEQNDSLTFSVTANRFLRGMVRALVGTMLDVGEGKLSLDDFKEILESKNRQKAGRSVPACGLYLTNIEYPDSIKI